MKISKQNLIVNLLLFVIVSFALVSSIVLNQNELTVYANVNVTDGVYYAGNTKSNKVSLMINVYWGTEFILPILDELDKYNAKCTFFLGGMWAKDNEALIKEMLARGHELGNHGYYHKNHANLDSSAQRNEIYNTNQLVKELCDYDIKLFAPPSGSYNKTTVMVASDLGMKTIMWTRDTIDWRDKDEVLIYSRAIKNMKGGDLILAHPTEKTLEALPKILNYIYSNGFVADCVSQTISE
ncbi:MAG: polysaccharide deacetylase family protein [Clostridia bacterium]|nr:polysaccharide deacetylase family protein [Clostridia bacterium]